MPEGDNVKLEPIKSEEPKSEEKKPTLMVIEMSIEGKMTVHFPLLNDKIATYGFLKMAEKILDRHYLQIEQPKIIPAKGGIMNFVRGRG